jgi:hypothetical protein
MRFRFGEGNVFSGGLTFAGTGCCILVSDYGNDAVHVIDVVHGKHVGYVAGPGSVAGPRGVAARKSLVAVSAWQELGRGDHIVQIYEGSGETWTPVRVLGGGFGFPGRADGQLDMPAGLRFSGGIRGVEDDDDHDHDMTVVVAERWNDRLSMFRARDGAFVRHVVTGVLLPADVQEFENGWLVAGHEALQFVREGDNMKMKMKMKMKMDFAFGILLNLALIRGVGLVASDSAVMDLDDDRLLYDGMSASRVGWMVAVAKGISVQARHECSIIPELCCAPITFVVPSIRQWTRWIPIRWLS